jgi:hypothetical protein
MDPGRLLISSALLGAFVLCGGIYGVSYSFGVIWRRRSLRGAAYVAFTFQVALCLILLAYAPLLAVWKALIAISCVLYYFVPPVTLRYLVRLHETAETQ